ncbi:MAG TPA: TRAP transporter small permease subunit [Desulfatirhabdiaceae bacterium]|nr:TRAP transporter small permease subunit [Desulfatirhabdiaceae bacterium]
MMHPFLKTVNSIQQFNHRLSAASEAIGMFALFSIMILTFIDVIGAKVFLKPVLGSIDMVMVAQLVAISFAAASTLIAGGQISVDFFLLKMPKSIRNHVLFFTDTLCLLLFLLIGWRLAVYGYQVYHEGEVTPTAHIPLYPFAFGFMLAMIPVCIELIVKMIKRFIEQTLKEYDTSITRSKA